MPLPTYSNSITTRLSFFSYSMWFHMIVIKFHSHLHRLLYWQCLGHTISDIFVSVLPMTMHCLWISWIWVSEIRSKCSGESSGTNIHQWLAILRDRKNSLKVKRRKKKWIWYSKWNNKIGKKIKIMQWEKKQEKIKFQ